MTKRNKENVKRENVFVLYRQTPLLCTPLGPEKVSILRGVLIKRVNFKENVWSGTKKTKVNNKQGTESENTASIRRTKKTVRNSECPY